MTEQKKAITVIGAGVIGLTTALQLASDAKNEVLVVAEFMPGDYDIGYASPWAGANFFPMGEAGSLQAQLEADSWAILKHLATNMPASCIHMQDAVVYTRTENAGLLGPLFIAPGQEPWWKSLVDNYRSIPTTDLPQGIAAGSKFTSLCINTVGYLHYLLSQCRQRNVSFLRQRLSSLDEAFFISNSSGRCPDVVVNATGLGSRTLAGVMDSSMYPARGQTVLVQNDPGYMMAVSPGRAGDGFGYCMTRPAGGGTIVGGCYVPHDYNPDIDIPLARKFMKTVVDFCPEIVSSGQGDQDLKIVRHNVGLRPVREGGPRIENECMVDESTSSTRVVVHCYGHGGFGYQTSWASAAMVCRIIEEVNSNAQARL